MAAPKLAWHTRWRASHGAATRWPDTQHGTSKRRKTITRALHKHPAGPPPFVFASTYQKLRSQELPDGLWYCVSELLESGASNKYRRLGAPFERGAWSTSRTIETDAIVSSAPGHRTRLRWQSRPRGHSQPGMILLPGLPVRGQAQGQQITPATPTQPSLPKPEKNHSTSKITAAPKRRPP